MKSKAILTALAATALLVGCEKKPSVEKAQEQAKSAVESAKDAAKSASEAARTATEAANGGAFVKENSEAQALKSALEKYEKEATPSNEADVDQAITDVNGKIAELQEKAAKATGAEKDEATAQVKSLTEFRNEETARFAKAKAAPTPSEPQSSLQKLEDGAKDAGHAIKETAKSAGEKLKEAGESAGEKLDDARESAGDAIKRAGEAIKPKDN